MADGMTPRERRKARASKPGSGIDMSGLRKMVVPLVVIGVLAVVVFMVVNREAAESECPGHWHATFGIWVDGERVQFQQPPYSLRGEGGDLPFSMHMHAPDQETLHFEPQIARCQPLRETFALLGVELRGSALEIEEAGHNIAGTFRDNATNELRAWVANPSDDGNLTWEERDWSRFVGMGQLKDGARVLMVSGNATAAQIQGYQAQIRPVAGF